jgi:putative glutamine amidotransferase
MLPVVIPPFEDERRAAAIAASVDGILLTGGEDVDPARYGAAPHAKTGAPHSARDRSEIALVIAAKTMAVPTLAICRGLQILNVALGGTLIQDIASERPLALPHTLDGPRNVRTHAVRVREGSRLAAALGATELGVNSSHHQSLARVASGITVTATAPDGIVEGAESDGDRWWMLGVQWHPEELTATAEDWDRALFEAFRRAAATHAAVTAAKEGSPPATTTGSTALR